MHRARLASHLKEALLTVQRYLLLSFNAARVELLLWAFEGTELLLKQVIMLDEHS